MTKYLWRDGKWIDKATGKVAPRVNRLDLSKPTASISSDYEGYQCPVTDKWIEGRKAHMENLKQVNCRLLEPGEREHNTKRGRKYVDDKMDAAIDKAVDEVARGLFI
ncbi:MAG: hypothetical protein O3C57_01310 [Verrucomicrobia bacterium]|nr:hypothetical protein [Verrucomicrobiota bacterium]